MRPVRFFPSLTEHDRFQPSMLETCDWWKADATAKDTRDRCKITSRFCRIFRWLFIRLLSCTASWTIVAICRSRTIPAIGPEKYCRTSVKNAYVATDTSVRRTGSVSERKRKKGWECEKGKKEEEDQRETPEYWRVANVPDVCGQTHRWNTVLRYAREFYRLFENVLITWRPSQS